MRRFVAGVLALAISPSVAFAAPVASALAGSAPTPAEPASGPVRVAMRQETLPPGGKLPEHRQAGQRYLYVVSGRLKVSDLVTGAEQVVEAGGMAAEQPGDWHAAEVLGGAPVVLYLIDRTPADEASTAAAP
jgi:quercetin dioxygenase-like cupin family protein